MSKLIYLAAALALSCGPTRHAPGDDDNGGGDGGNNQGSGLGSSCATDTVTAMSTPLDIYIMLDQSGSMMMDNKWPNVTSAIKTFVMQPNLNGISVGLQYFGLDNNSCTASTYATPEVEIAQLPGVASQIATSISGHSPNSGTPTSAALQGAIDHASSWASAHPGDTTVVVLATDGDPEECDLSLTDIDNIAAAGATATPKILTFVIGVGSSLSNLNGIAAAGGTGSAFLVDTNGSADQEFLNALNTIRGTALGCTYQIPIPSMGSINYNQVNIVYTPGGGGSPMTVPQVSGASACPATGNAWYYDNPAAPTEIVLCSSTCGTVEADTTGSVGITLGCTTVIE
jgi:hypothetical protein